MKKKIILILGMVIMVFLLLNIEIGKPYLITGDRERDANCLGYSKEVRDEINSAGGKATLIIFRKDKEQGHCLVLVKYGRRVYGYPKTLGALNVRISKISQLCINKGRRCLE